MNLEQAEQGSERAAKVLAEARASGALDRPAVRKSRVAQIKARMAADLAAMERAGGRE